MPRLVELLVVLSLLFSVCLGRDDRGFARLLQPGQDSFVGVIALVGDRDVGRQRSQQRICPFQIARLACRQVQAGRVAERIHGQMDLGTATASAKPNGLVAPFLSAPGLC